MIRPVLAIAVNSFREAVRSKVLAVLVLFAVLLSLSAVVLGQMSLHEERRITIDIAMFMSTIFSVIIAIYTTVTSLQTELDRRTIYTLLSKPIGRGQLIVGKYLGVVALMFAVTAGMFGMTTGLLLLQDYSPTIQLVIGFLTIFLQTALVTGLSLMFASFSTPLLTGMMTASVFIVGHLLSLLDEVVPLLKSVIGPGADAFVSFVKIVVPNFEQLNLAEAVVHSTSISGTYVASAVAYTATEVILLLGFATVVFNRRDFA